MQTFSVRRAVRTLFSTPLVTIVAIASLALGIGANAVMFGVVDRLLLSPPQHVDAWENVRHLYIRSTDTNRETTVGRTMT